MKRTRVALAEVGKELGGMAVRVVREVDEGCAQGQRYELRRGNC